MAKKENFRIEICDRADEGLMSHLDIELLFVVEGSLEVSVENRVSHLDQDDVFVINSGKKHRILASEGALFLRIQTDPQLVREATGSAEVIFLCDSKGSENTHYDELRTLLRRMLDHYVESPDYTRYFSYQADCYGVLDRLVSHFMMNMKDVSEVHESDRYEERLRQINNYIDANYDQDISMKELSEKLFLSNGYLSRFFKKNYGTNFAGYLMNVRVFHAADDLLYTDLPITRVAYNNGFTTAAQFNKAFKKVMNKTPSDFRKQSQASATPEQEQHRARLTERLERVVVNGERDTGEKREEPSQQAASFSAEESVRMAPWWGRIINFANADNLRDSEIRQHLLMLRQGLGFTYVRIWSLFLETMYIRPEDERYNFSQADSVLDFILEQGMKPYIDLGLKPRRLHYGAGRSAETSFQDEVPAQSERFTKENWKRLIGAFLRHLGHRYGPHEMDDWYFELWFNEDRRDSEQGMEDYLAYFGIARRLIKGFNANIQFGGYGIRMDFGHERRVQFLRRWKESGDPPDFLSVMYYSYERGEDGLDRYARRTTDNDALLHRIQKEKQVIQEAGMADLPLHLNEWNLTPSVRNYINDSVFKGAYIVKNVIDMYGLVDEMGYGAGSDRAYGSFDTPELLYGGTGLLSRDGIMKPAAFAYEFLGRLLPYFVGKGKDYLVTTDRHDDFAIVCHNQQQLNYNYFLTAERELERDKLWRYFVGRKNAEITVTLTDVPEGSYRVKTYRVNEENGSVLSLWRDLSFDNELSRNDVKYLRRASEPKLTIRTQQTERNALTIREELRPNEFALIRVLKIEEI